MACARQVVMQKSDRSGFMGLKMLELNLDGRREGKDY